MRETGLTDADLAIRMSPPVSRHAVGYWRTGHRVPTPRRRLEIQRLTGGAVPADAWGGVRAARRAAWCSANPPARLETSGTTHGSP